MQKPGLVTQKDMLRVLGSDGTTFRPGSLGYIAIIAGLQAGNHQLDPEDKIPVLNVIDQLCWIAHTSINAGTSAEQAMGYIYREMFVNRTVEYHAAMQSFKDHLDLSADWINLMAEEGATRHD